MNKFVKFWIVPFWVFPMLATAAPAAVKDGAPRVVAERDREAPSGRAVQVTLAQQEIDTTVDLGRVAQSNGGGLLGYLLIEPIDRRRRDTMNAELSDEAERNALPLRRELKDFDVTALALATTKAALATVRWFNPTVFVMNSGDTNALSQITGITPQIATIAYRYDLSPDFTQIRVYVDLRIDQRIDKGNASTKSVTRPIYHQRVLSVVQLRNRSYEARENARAWAANNGALAKAAIALAFEDLKSSIPYALGLTEADINGFGVKGRERAFAAGFYGPLLTRKQDDRDNIIIWNNGVIHIQPIS